MNKLHRLRKDYKRAQRLIQETEQRIIKATDAEYRNKAVRLLAMLDQEMMAAQNLLEQ